MLHRTFANRTSLRGGFWGLAVLALAVLILIPAQAWAWQSAQHHLSFVEPSGWEPIKATNPKIVASFKAPSKDKNENGYITVSISSMASQHKDVDEDFTQELVNKIANEYFGKVATVQEANLKTVAGCRGGRFVVIKNQGHYQFKTVNDMCIRNGHMHIFTMTSSPENYSKFLPTFEKMMNTAKFN